MSSNATQVPSELAEAIAARFQILTQDIYCILIGTAVLGMRRKVVV
jgi:hypothetical protein